MKDTTSALTIPWNEDPLCLELMRQYPDGVPLQIIAIAYGRDANAIFQTERAALKKLRQRCEQLRELLHDDSEPLLWERMEQES